MSDPTRLMVFGFDAAPGDLIHRWVAAGELPVLERLMAAGATVPLGSLADHLPESIWGSLTTGCEPGGHGIYNWRETKLGTYVRGRRPLSPPVPTFWRALRDGGAPAGDAPRALLLDVHGAAGTADPGITYVTWGLRGAAPHELGSFPPAEFERVVDHYGGYATNLNRELSGRPVRERLQLRTLQRMVVRRTDILLDLMQRHPWELCGTIFFEAHSAAHAFHQYVKREDYLEPVPRGRGLEDALLRVYRAVDAGIGRLIEAAPPDTHVAVVSGMGMRPNTNGLTLLPRALEALGYTVPATASAAARRRERLRRLALTVVPRPVARAVRRRVLDPATVDRHAEQLWTESTDWSRTRAWAEAEQGSGWIRLNVAGREPNGIVHRGRDYDELCAQIAADLLELREVGSGQPAIAEAVHRSELTSGPYEEALPDLLVKWTNKAVVRRAHHPRIGIVEDDGSDWQVSEHDDDGWLVLSGPQVRPGARATDARLEDLAPTLIHLMGGVVPRHVDGRTLTELLEPEAGPLQRESDDIGDETTAAV